MDVDLEDVNRNLELFSSFLGLRHLEPYFLSSPGLPNLLSSLSELPNFSIHQMELMKSAASTGEDFESDFLMELKNSLARKFESDFLFHKCPRRSEGVDWISQLPDDIIVHILSFLPLKEAVATSLVSRRWSRLWTYIPNLIFQTVNGESLENTEWVNSVLKSHKSPFLKQVTICFYIQHDLQVLTRWLHFALSRQVQSLKLDFRFSPPILGRDILSSSIIRSSDFRFLRELELALLDISGEAMEFFLHNCSSLERLILRKVTLKSDLMVSGTSLKHFYIKRVSNGAGKSVEVSCPNLTSLACNYELDRIFLKNAPNLRHASVVLFEGETMIQFAKAATTFEIMNLKILIPKVFTVPQMPQLKKLVLKYAEVNKDFLLPVTDILQACPYLQEFTIKNNDYGHYVSEFPFANIFEVPKLGKVAHSCLRAFEFEGFCGKIGDHMELLMHIVRNCAALERIIVVPSPPIIVEESDCLRNCWDFLERNPYHYVRSRHYAVTARQRRASQVKIKRCIVELLAAKKIPPHIKLVVV